MIRGPPRSALFPCTTPSRCSQTIAVVDTTAPVITCSANKNVEAGAAFSFDAPSATDVGGTNSISIVSTVTNAAGCSYNAQPTWRPCPEHRDCALLRQTNAGVYTTAP